MSKFYPLSVANVRNETRDTIVVMLDVAEDLKDKFVFAQGQHLTLRTEINGEDVRRSYSICSGVYDGDLRIAIKRATGGVFSTWASESLAVGDTLEVMPPLVHFGLAPDPTRARNYVGFAAGSGITPLLSIVGTTLAAEPASEFTLFYGNRASGTVMFRDELADLKDAYLTRFNLVHVLSREAQDIELLHGRIDREKAGALLDRWVDLATVDAVYVCGPDGMMQAVGEALRERGVSEVRFAPRAADERLWFDALQVAVPLRGLSRTLRLL